MTLTSKILMRATLFALSVTVLVVGCATGGSSVDSADSEANQTPSTANDSGPPQSALQAAERWVASPPGDLPDDVTRVLDNTQSEQSPAVERVVRIDDATYHAVVSSESNEAILLVVRLHDSGTWRVEEARIRDAREFWPGIKK